MGLGAGWYRMCVCVCVYVDSYTLQSLKDQVSAVSAM